MVQLADFSARRSADPGARWYDVFRNRRGDTASTRVVLTISVPEQQEDAYDKHAETVSQLPRSARAEHLAQNQAQVERAHMHQLPLQNVLPSPQVAAPHAARFIAML